MGMILGDGQTLGADERNPYVNDVNTDIYLYCSVVHVEPLARFARVVVWFYQNKTARLNGCRFYREVFDDCTGDEYDRYFSESVLSGEGITPKKTAYDWLHTIGRYAKFVSDE